MATPQLTFNTGQTAILMADFHREGMGDNPMVREHGTVQKARAVLEAARQAGVLVVYIVVTPFIGAVSNLPRQRQCVLRDGAGDDPPGS